MTARKRPYDLWTLSSLLDWLQNGPQAFVGAVNGGWQPARPIQYTSIWNRLRLAWLVFRYKADAFVWDLGEREKGEDR